MKCPRCGGDVPIVVRELDPTESQPRVPVAYGDTVKLRPNPRYRLPDPWNHECDLRKVPS